jgi:hypothetical protein
MTEMNRKHSASARPRRPAIAILAALATILAGAFAGNASAHPSAPAGEYTARAGTYVGQLQGTTGFVAVLVGETGALRAYALDPTQRLAAWSAPASPDPTMRDERLSTPYGRSLTSSNGFSLQATITSGQIAGSVNFPSGERHPFDARQVACAHALHEILIGEGPTRYLGGWVVWDKAATIGYLDLPPVVQALMLSNGDDDGS